MRTSDRRTSTSRPAWTDRAAAARLRDGSDGKRPLPRRHRQVHARAGLRPRPRPARAMQTIDVYTRRLHDRPRRRTPARARPHSVGDGEFYRQQQSAGARRRAGHRDRRHPRQGAGPSPRPPCRPAAPPAARTSTRPSSCPSERHWFWEGHLKDFDFSAAGDVLTPTATAPSAPSSTRDPAVPGDRHAAHDRDRLLGRGHRDARRPTTPQALRRVRQHVDLRAADDVHDPGHASSTAVAGSTSSPADNTVAPYSTLTSPTTRRRDMAAGADPQPARLHFQQQRDLHRAHRRQRRAALPGRHLPLEPGGGRLAQRADQRGELPDLRHHLSHAHARDLRGRQRRLPARLPRRQLADARPTSRRSPRRGTTAAPARS